MNLKTKTLALELETPAVTSENRDLGQEFRDMVRKFLPILRLPVYGLSKAADWLEAWINDALPPPQLLDTSVCLASETYA